VWQALCGLLEQTPGLRPPRVHELAQMLSLEPARIQAVLLRASNAGLVYRVAPNRFFLPQTVVELGGLAEELCSQSPERAFTAAQYRNRSDLGRNLTIEVLEFLDRMGLTQRTGDARRMLGSPQDLAIQAGPDEPTGT
jgi:selenocysteine-specific elongation factor